jgi:diaminopimelate epimerase
MPSATLPFSKMHGCGNDYVIVDGFHHAVADWGALSRRVSDRRFGVGSDGLIVALPSDKADFRMRMFNVDGSESEMCGNGLRCLTRFAVERGLVAKKPGLNVETGAGVLGLEVRGSNGSVESVTIDMGKPRLERAEIPMKGPKGRAVDERIDVGGRPLAVTAVSMGNPHAVTYVDVDPMQYPVETVGPQVETHPSFPRRTNAHFVQVVSPREVRLRTWERGCGETMAFGTGACAVTVAGVLTGRTERDLLLHVRGGDLRVRWDAASDHVFLSGPAVEVYQGSLPLA